MKIKDIVLSFRSVFLMKPFVRLRVGGFFFCRKSVPICLKGNTMEERIGRIGQIQTDFFYPNQKKSV
jgi:hypothetical protein